MTGAKVRADADGERAAKQKAQPIFAPNVCGLWNAAGRLHPLEGVVSLSFEWRSFVPRTNFNLREMQ